MVYPAISTSPLTIFKINSEMYPSKANSINTVQAKLTNCTKIDYDYHRSIITFGGVNIADQ